MSAELQDLAQMQIHMAQKSNKPYLTMQTQRKNLMENSSATSVDEESDLGISRADMNMNQSAEES